MSARLQRDVGRRTASRLTRFGKGNDFRMWASARSSDTSPDDATVPNDQGSYGWILRRQSKMPPRQSRGSAHEAFVFGQPLRRLGQVRVDRETVSQGDHTILHVALDIAVSILAVLGKPASNLQD